MIVQQPKVSPGLMSRRFWGMRFYDNPVCFFTCRPRLAISIKAWVVNLIKYRQDAMVAIGLAIPASANRACAGNRYHPDQPQAWEA